MDNFDRAMDFIFKWEGYRSDHPDDPGGLTMLGLSSRYYPGEVSEMAAAPEQRAREIAREVYRREYWDRCGCAGLPYPLDVIVMDTAVNMGVSRALKLKDGAATWQDYLFKRIERYAYIGRKRPEFLRGWINRVTDLYKTVRPSEHPLSREYV
ncbi:MAG: hypothetical protein BMS9Abin24_099 [Thermodesulfobacteriota bacterium]|nr:MAG: hypothetical protein BMS9Abin24_099 [Thermodesulfobacteriota bacterium]